MEELDGATGRHRLLWIAAHRLAGQHGHGGPSPLAPPSYELVQDVVEIAA